MAGRRKGGASRGPDAVRVTRWLRTAFEAHGAGKLREAERLARRVLGAIPDQPDALHLLATVARESGRTDLAIDLYERLLRKHPGDTDRAEQSRQPASGAQGMASEQSHATKPPSPTTAATCPRTSTSGAHCCTSTIRSGPNPACARRRRSSLTTHRFVRRSPARSSSRERRRRRSRRCAARSSSSPDSTDLQNDAGVVHGTIGDFDTARDHYRSALALDPGNAKAALNLAKTKRFTAAGRRGRDLILRRGRALRLRTRAAQRDLDLALGKIHDDRGEWEAAFAHYEKANRPFSAAALEAGRHHSLALMDRMRAVFDSRLVRDASRRDQNPDPTPVFIVGMPRSGTTLVEQLLAAHPDVHGAGELSGITSARGRGRCARR